jgi:hypothetical protein
MIGKPDSLTLRFASLVGPPGLTIFKEPCPKMQKKNILNLKKNIFEIFENFNDDDYVNDAVGVDNIDVV